MPIYIPVTHSQAESLDALVRAGLENLRSTVHGLSIEQIRSRPVPSSELTLEWLLLHVGGVAMQWTERAQLAPGRPEFDDLPFAEQAAFGEQLMQLPEDATTQTLLETYDQRIAPALDRLAALATGAGMDLDAEVPLPDVPWFRPGLGPVTARWCLHHLVMEIQRHSGHADILREAIDGGTMYELIGRDQGEDLGFIEEWFAAHA